MIYYFIFCPLLLLFHMYQKPLGLAQYIFQKGSLTYQREISVQDGYIILEISYWTLWITIQCALQCSLILALPIQSLIWWFHLFWLMHTDKHNIRQDRVKWDRQQLRNFNHKGKHKIWCYTKSLLTFTT